MRSTLFVVALIGLLANGQLATAGEAHRLTRVEPNPSGDWATGAYIIRDTAAWRALWARHVEYNPSAGPIPLYDFSRYALVGISLGYTARCERIDFLGAADTAESTVVRYARVPAAAPARCKRGLGPLVGFALLPKGSLPIRFAFESRD